MYLPKIIAICGHKMSGKDTLAKYIIEKYNYKHIKIASKLKDTMKLLFGFTDEQLEVNKETIDPRWQITPRQAMQYFGTDIMQFHIKHLLPNMERKFWIKSIVTEIDSCPDPELCFVISDLRFLHEYNELTKYDLKVIQVDRFHKHDPHLSENEYKSIPYNVLLKNTGTESDLRTAFDAELNKWQQ